MQEKLDVLPGQQPEQAHTGNLPVQLTPLIDREQKVSALYSMLCRPGLRLLTLTGPPGIGKTRLALQVASELIDDFTDGVFFVPLAPISDPALVAPTIAQVFELKEAGSESIADLLQVYLQHKHLLLLLDNFEQVLSAAALLTRLLVTCPGIKVLVTSREVLRLRGEQQYPVPPLEVPDPRHSSDIETIARHGAVALFLQRAQAIKPNFALTRANAQAIAAICQRLDGLPLAIELAAARIKILSPQDLLARLEHRLQVLTHSPHDLPERQQTLRSTITWSYNLLSAQEQRLFRRLSIFVGGCTLQAVEAVCTALGDEAESVLDGVTSLVDKSLLQQIEQGEEGQSDQRLMMLETIREYGLECLRASGEMEATRRAHADYYLALAEEAERQFRGPQQMVWMEQLEREHDNLRAAMRWSLEQGETEHKWEIALRLGGALRIFWQVRGHLSEGQAFLEQALAENAEVAVDIQAKAYIAAARLALNQGNHERGQMLCEKGLVLCRESGDTLNIGYVLFLLSWVEWARGNLQEAGFLLEKSLTLYREVGDVVKIAYGLYELAYAVRFQGEYTMARDLLEESLAMFRKLEDKAGIAHSLNLLAEVLFASKGDFALLRSLHEEAMVHFRELGDKESIAWCFGLSGRLALSEGDVTAARSLVEESVALFKEIGHRWGAAESLSVLGHVLAVEGNLAGAHTLYEESLALAREIGYQLWIAPCLEGLASVIAAQGEPILAAGLWGSAEALRESMGAPMPPVECTTYEQAVASARSRAGEEVFVVAWARGRNLTPEQSLAARSPIAISLPVPAEPPQSAPSPSTKAPIYPASLTAREVVVLRLLAQGLTSAQIAERLVLSLLTVNTHVRSIYSKLGVTSRSAATRWAIEHKLV